MELELDINAKTQLSNGSTKREVHRLNERLLRGLVTGIGVSQLTTIMPQAVPCYFRHTCTPLEQFTHQVVPDGIVADINNHINETSRWIREEYLTAKESGSSSTELIEMLEGVLKTVEQKISLLKDQSFCDNTLSVFALEGSIHLMILQEIALLNNAIETNRTPFSDEIRKTADEYVDHIDKSWMSLVTARVRAVSGITVDMTTDISDGPFESLATIRWDDQVLGKHYLQVTRKDNHGEWDKGSPEELVEKAKVLKAAHVNEAIDHMDVSMVSAPLQAIGVWDMLRRPLVLP